MVMTTVNLEIPMTTDSRWEKVKRIFRQFDFNRDGGLNRDEMAALVVALNPRIKFSADHINAINEAVFQTYAQFIDGEKGLTINGLLCTYDDGAGDLDRDFATLGLDLRPVFSSSLTNYGIMLNTWKLADDLRRFLKTLDFFKVVRDKSSHPGWSRELGQFRKMSEESEPSQKYALLSRELRYFRSRADEAKTTADVVDRHMAMGRVLYSHNLHSEALSSFKGALYLQPTNNIRSHFYAGNCLHELGRYGKARVEFLNALEKAKAVGASEWDYLIPRIHVNLGIVLENEGMIFHACEHYREALSLSPTHVRSLKLFGSALVLVGEYKAGIYALQEAISWKKNYVDARYDLALALGLMGDEDMAVLEFQRVLDLKPGDVDALFNLGAMYLDMGRYLRAYKMYRKVLVVWPNHWKAQLGSVVTLFGSGEIQEAKKDLKDVLKTRDKVELRDRITYLKQLQNRRLQGKGSNGNGMGNYIIVEPSKFKTADETTTLRRELASAVDIRTFQKTTKLHQCDVELIKKQMNENTSFPDSVSSPAERSVRKPYIEGILRELLSFLKPETFVAAVKAINLKILSVLDEPKSGMVDLGLFFAVIAPLCRGSPDKRKRVAYHALLWLPGNAGSTMIRITDAHRYFKLLRALYMVSDDKGGLMLGINDKTDTSMIDLTDFLALFDDPDCGFGIMSTLLKLETGERNGSYVCGTCRSVIIGSRFKEIKSHFSLCSHCYSQGKVPSTCEQEDYT